MDQLERFFEDKDPVKMETFGMRLRNQFAISEGYRRPKELEWLESLRQYKGLYDPEVQIDKNNSKVYPKLTRSKINIVLSRLHEMLFPEIDRNWELLPTPEPQVPKDVIMMLALAMIKPPTEESPEPTPPTMEELQAAVKEYADATCEKMANVIDDQLTEMDYADQVKKVLRSGLLYGTGIMKGPLINKRVKNKWKPADNGDFEAEETVEDKPYLEFVRIWDWYPDLTTTEMENIEGSFQRHVMTRHDLRRLMRRRDFYGPVIEQYMKEHPDGDYVPKNWEVDLQVIEVEAGSGKSGAKGTIPTATTTSDTTTTRSSYRKEGKKYEVLEYWGYVDGYDLEACGVNIDDVDLEYEANVWLLGSRVIKVVLFNGALNEYKVFYYEKDETSIYGEGLARIMRHSQISISAAARMVLDNAACVAGPQVEVNWSLMTPDTDLNSFYPRKIWYREGKGIDAQYPALRVYSIDSHVTELLEIINAFKQNADEETTLPTWMIGQMVHNETAQATSGRMATITVSIKDVVKNFDAFTEKIISDLYAWNMDFNPRKDIKGDYKCKPKGVASLVMKEVRMAALTNMKNTLAPEDWMYIPRREFLYETFKSHDLDIKLRTEEEAEAYAASQRDERAIELAYAQMEADIAYKKAQSLGQLTKAKKANTEATIAANTPPETTPAEDPRLAEAEYEKKKIEQEGQIAKIRREEEAHALKMKQQEERQGLETARTGQEMVHKEDEHALNVTSEALSASENLRQQREKHEHGMKMAEMKAKSANFGAKKPKKAKKR